MNHVNNVSATMRESEERFRLLTEVVPQLVWSSLPDGFIDYCNARWLSYTGMTHEQVQGDGWAHALHADDRAATLAAWKHATESGVEYQIEQRLRAADGTFRCFLTRAQPLRDAAGKVLKWYGTCTDIEDRKRAEHDQKLAQEALRASERRFRAIIEQSFDAVVLIAADGTLRYVSPSAEDILGYPPAELVGHSGFALVHPDDRPRIEGLFAEILQAPGAAATAISRSQHRDGSWRWVEAVGTNLLAEPDVAAVVVHYRDITERKHSTEQLVRTQRQSDELLALFETLLSNAPVGFAFLDCDLRYVRVNHALAAMNGPPIAGHLGRTVQEVVPDLWPRLGPIYRSLLAGGEPVTNVAVSGKTAAAPDEVRHWLASYYPVRTQGEIIGIGVIVNDVTEAKRREEQSRQSQKMEAIGRLAGGVAHDFNNLLTVITGYCDMLLVTAPGPAESRPLLEAILKAGERAAGLTGQLLAFGRKQMLQPRVLELNGLIANIREMLGRMIGEDVQLATDLAPDLALIKADASQLEQVLINLAVNARDAMPQGGTMTVATANVDVEGTGTNGGCAGAPPGRFVVLAVSDTGIGMDRETQAHLFEPFFTTKGKGTGLGLATVYGIVQQSGGHIQARSEVGRGTTFNVYFPALSADARPNPTQPETLPLRGSETVLLVEDEPEVRELTGTLLERFGYRVLTAGGGAEALKLAAENRGGIDLLLTDVVMPAMSGRQLAEALLSEYPRMKVLYLSGYTEDAVVKHGVLANETAFLNKPFTTSALAAKVREVLDRPNGDETA